MFHRALLAAAAIGLPCIAWPQATPDFGANDPCRAEVAKFERAIGFIRQNQGNQAAQALKEKLLPAKVENEILMSEGYCGLAKYIKDKKLNK
jgi:hypothetical protein